MALNADVVEATANEEFKNVAGLHAITAGLSAQNQLTNQQLVTTIDREAVQSGIAIGREIMMRGIDLSRAAQARALRYVFAPSSEETAGEAVSFAKTIAADLSSKLADVQGLLASGQIQEKIAITTPPQTGTGGAFGSAPGSALYAQIAEALALAAALRNISPKEGA